MFATGISIFLSLVFIFIKLRRRTMLRLLSHDMALDVGVTLLMLLVHWGSFAGVMAATFAGLMTSVATSAAKRTFGYIKAGQYVPGLIHLSV
jgi:nucleoside permease NupC